MYAYIYAPELIKNFEKNFFVKFLTKIWQIYETKSLAQYNTFYFCQKTCNTFLFQKKSKKN